MTHARTISFATDGVSVFSIFNDLDSDETFDGISRWHWRCGSNAIGGVNAEIAITATTGENLLREGMTTVDKVQVVAER